MTDHNVVVIRFAEESKAYQAFSELRTADSEGRISVRSGVIATRDLQGRLKVAEGEDNVIGSGIAGGGLIGMLVGVLGGPLGLLLGWGAGALVGSLYDAERADRTDGVLGNLSNSVAPGTTAIIGEVEEVTPEVLAGVAGPLGGTVERRSADEVLAELEAADQAAAAAAAKADDVLREQRKVERHQKWEDRLASVKAKFHRGD